MDKLFDKLPYDTLEDIPPVQVLAGAGGVGLVLFLLAYFTLFSAINTEFETLAKKKTDTENTLKRYRKMVANKDVTLKKMIQKVGELSAQKKQMPQQEVFNNLLEHITKLGEKRDVDVISFQMAEGKLNDFYKEIPLNITFRGELWGTMDMFSALQNMLQLVDIKYMSFSTDSVDVYTVGGPNAPIQSVPMLISQFTAITYVYIEGSEEKAKK
ncbi:MAG: type 4a pilus biogenesis protein PilO [Nitrospinaceae bacterium]|nr:type 4a pilus biogenesis protein PilO [Nitrospinaceae bacterium]